MARVCRLLLTAAVALALTAAIPAGALAHTASPRLAPDTCHGTVFGNVQLQNVASHLYLAESTVSDQAVLYSKSDQRWDGFRDRQGFLIIFRCGTHDALTDALRADCRKGYKDCARVAPYTNSTLQRWTRKVSGKGSVWTIQSLGAGALNKVINDPAGSKVSGTFAVMSKYSATRTTEQFASHS